jgi:glutathione S-transferase
MHSGFPNIRAHLPMNARATGRVVEIMPEMQREIGRVESLWSDLRNRYSGTGPWLFGQFSIADCMYAPLVFRFNTYGVNLNGEARVYMQNFLAHPLLKGWQESSQNETEVIERVEVGRVTDVPCPASP